MRIHLCGNLVVELDDADATPLLAGRQGRLLLAYLVANRDRVIRRDELIELLWPVGLPSSPEASLSSLLTGVRRTLGRDAISGRSAILLQLPPDAWIDVEVARELAESAERALATGDAPDALEQARSALDLSSGTLLAEFHGDWVERLRADVEQLRCDVLETGARAALAMGDAELHTAERLARSLIDAEPYRESGYALLMDALARSGRVAEALRTFDHVRVLLRDELGVSPAAALTTLHERLLTHGEASPAAARRSFTGLPLPELPLPAPIVRGERRSFVAREAELARLRERWAEVQRGRGELVLLTGEAGIGKTRLTARFAAEAYEHGAAIIYGRADEDTVVPFQPFAEALSDLVRHLDVVELGVHVAALEPLLPTSPPDRAPSAGDPRDRRHALFEAVSAVLGRIAGLRPLIVIVEDLHWADKPTLLLLRQVVRHAEGAPIMVLATYRDVDLTAGAPLPRLIADLRREHVLQRVSLAGLDDLGTAALVSARAANGADAADAVRLREYTAGNPFFIEEMIRSIDAVDDPRLVRVPESVQEIILQRVERLERRTRELLTWGAIVGREFTLAALVRLVDSAPEEVLEQLEEAELAGLIVEHPECAGRFSFCHTLVREAVYARPTGSRRALLHLRAGELLGAELRDAELAHHFYLARHVGGAGQAVNYGVRAGEAAARALAYEEAASHFVRALEALDVMPEADEGLRTEILLALGAVRWQGGEAGARSAFDGAAELARRRGDGDALVRAALGAGGRFYVPGREDREYIELLEEALDSAHEPGDRARLLARLAESLVSRPDHARARDVSREAMRLAREAEDDEALAVALLSRHAALLDVSHLDERVRVAQSAIVIADRMGMRDPSALARHWFIYDLVEAGELGAARECHRELQELAQELGQPLYRHSALAWRGVWAQLGGRDEEAERLAREGLRLAERAGARDAHVAVNAQLLVTRREQGRLAELIPDIERYAAEGSPVLAWSALLPLAYVEVGDVEKASAALAFAEELDFWGLHRLAATMWLGEAAAGIGDRAASARLYGELAPYAGRLAQASFTGCWGAVDRVLGLLAAASGRGQDAVRHLEAALARHRALDAQPLIARTERDLAALG